MHDNVITIHEPELTTSELRSALGCFPTGVAIATTVNSDSKPLGLTINSFNSVSMDPPLILWSLANNSPSLEAFTYRGAFAINILSSDQRSVCSQFARPAHDKFAGIGWHTGHRGDREPSMQSLVQDVIGLWDELDIGRSHFLGLSMGGMTGVGIALHSPTRINRLVACNCRLDAPDFFRALWDRRIAQVQSGGMAVIVDDTLASWLCEDTRTAQGSQAALARQLILETDPAGYIACAGALKHLDYRDSLARLTAPTLFLVGEQDGVHPATMRALTRLAPNARYLGLENAAHLSNLEQPRAFNRGVMEFLLETDTNDDD